VGGEPYIYIVPYENDLQKVLDKLREREFKAGRYNPVVPNLAAYMDGEKYLKLAPGAKHTSIDAAREAAQESGTRSILDIVRIGKDPNYEVASPVESSRLDTAFGTDKPVEEELAGEKWEEGISTVLEEIERGMCQYFFLYKSNKPIKICFAGYSYD